MAYFEIDIDVVIEGLSSKHLTHRNLAAEAKVCPNTITNVLREGHARDRTVEGIARALGVPLNKLIKRRLDVQRGASETHSEEVPSTALATGALSNRDMQDQKLVLRSVPLSRRLISGRKLPGMAECFLEAEIFTVGSDRDKDRPVDSRMTYNHFIQPSIVVTLCIDEEANVLAYHREKRPQTPEYVHTTGVSILFACDPRFHLIRHPKTPFDKWLDATNNPTVAMNMLLAGSAPVLLQLVRDRIDLLKRKCMITPLGVITNDQRTKSVHRVYTQFVFQVELAVKDRNVDRFVRGISPNLCRVAASEDASKIFVGKHNKKNHMDIVAWHALHSERDTIRSGPRYSDAE